MEVSELLGVFDELPADTKIGLFKDGGQWQCTLKKDKTFASGKHEKFEVAIALALKSFYDRLARSRVRN